MTEQWQELKETITELRDNDGTGTQQEVSKFLLNLMDVLEKKMSSSEKPSQWIPCSERLPEDDTLMLVNYIDHRPDAVDIWIGWHEMEKVWYIDGEAHSREFDNEVIAWMPLPEPYKGEES